MLQLLDRDLQNTKIKNTSISMMLAELDRVERLLKQLLLHSHPIPLERILFDIHDLLNTVIRFEQDTANQIRFVRSFDISFPCIQANWNKLHLVLIKLLLNAVEASHADISETAHTSFCGKWKLAATNLDFELSYNLITVEDEVAGVPPKQHNQLFQPLFTTKHEGHGLGLSISHRLIQAHGGLLRYVPRDSAGSNFEVFLPHRISDVPI